MCIAACARRFRAGRGPSQSVILRSEARSSRRCRGRQQLHPRATLLGGELAVAFLFRQFTRRGASAAVASWTFLVSRAMATTADAVLWAVGAAVTGTRWGLLGAAGALVVAVPSRVLVAVLGTGSAASRSPRVGSGPWSWR